MSDRQEALLRMRKEFKKIKMCGYILMIWGIALFFILMLTGCSTRNMVKYKIEKCIEQGGMVERIQDENYRTVDIKCTERQKEKYIGE